MKRTATTYRKVVNYLERLDDVEEIERLVKIVEQRRRQIHEDDWLTRCRQRRDVLAAAGWIVPDDEHGMRLFFGRRGTLYTEKRWYVRGRHDGRKHVGLWVTRTPDEPRGRKTSVWLDVRDALYWKPESVSPVAVDGSTCPVPQGPGQLVVEDDRPKDEGNYVRR